MQDDFSNSLNNETTPKLNSGFFRYLFSFGLVCFGILVIVFITISRPPKNFQKDTLITVYSGMSTTDAATVLQGNSIVRSDKWLRLILSTRWKSKPIVVGDYIFEKPQSVFSIAYRITHGVYGNSRIKVTFPEGITVKNMADILTKVMPTFPVSDFIEKAREREGFLFPDTYYFFRTMSADQVIKLLSAQFEKKMTRFSTEFSNGTTTLPIYGKTRSENDIIIMASILEREANNPDEAKVISGILWKRMQKNIPLQVDATFLYTLNKGSSNLTLNDLQKDGPYNTYTRTGLPAGPIGNPGIEMIDAALHPVSSEYYYYLHDNQGMIHYGKSYQDHLKNKKMYLK